MYTNEDYIFVAYYVGTYGAQEAISVGDPGRLNITCILSDNSSALGCLSIVRGDSSATESFHVIKQSNNTASIEDLESDNYTVVTFDIEQNGIPRNQAAYLEEVELHGSANNLGTAMSGTS